MASELTTLPQTTEGKLVIYEDPEVIIARATKQANALMKIVEAKQLFTLFPGNKKHLDAPAWQVIAAFNNADPILRHIGEIKNASGEVTGYNAVVDLYQNERIISSGEMCCFLTEYPCQGKKGDDKHRAAKSAAQTWALSKAAKQKFAWVAVLGGYEPTPSEEMTQEQAKQSDNNPYWCREHKTLWFKKGKMPSFGHPVEGTEPTVWCHMPKEPEAAKQPTQKDTHPLAGDFHESKDETSPQSSETAPLITSAETSPTNDYLVEYDALYIEAQATGVKPLFPLSAQARLNTGQVAGAINNLRQKLAVKEQAQ